MITRIPTKRVNQSSKNHHLIGVISLLHRPYRETHRRIFFVIDEVLFIINSALNVGCCFRMDNSRTLCKGILDSLISQLGLSTEPIAFRFAPDPGRQGRFSNVGPLPAYFYRQGRRKRFRLARRLTLTRFCGCEPRRPVRSLVSTKTKAGKGHPVALEPRNFFVGSDL